MRSRFGLKAIGLACLLGTLATGQASASSVTIDNMLGTHVVNVTYTGVPTSGGSTTTGHLGANVIGTERDLSLTITGDSGGFSSNSFGVSGGELSLNLTTGASGYGISRYDAGSALNFDFLTALGATTANTFFQAYVLDSDLGIGFSAKFSDGANVATFNAPGLVAGSFINQALGSFSNAGSVDFTSIDWIEVMLTGSSSADAAVQLFEVTTTPQFDTVVPEPASLSLLGGGLMAVAWRLRRRMQATESVAVK